MTLEQIRITISAVKQTSLRQTIRYVKAAGVKPVGKRTRPRWYPDDAAAKVLAHLGVEPRSAPRILSMSQLRSVRAKAQKARRA